jgi:hypothetical protein
MDIRSKAVVATATLHLRDAEDNLMYSQKTIMVDGVEQSVDDTDKPCRVKLYSPGSKPFAKANAKKQNRLMERLRKKGKVDLTPEQNAQETAEFLTDCTAEWENVEYGDLTGREQSMGIYADNSIGFIADQVNKYLGDWANFTPAALTV